MVIDTTVFDSDLDAMITDMPASITYGTATFNGSVTELSQEEKLVLAGNDVQMALECIFPRAAVTAAINPQDRVVIQRSFDAATANYEIVSVKTSADGVAWHLIVKDDHRNNYP